MTSSVSVEIHFRFQGENIIKIEVYFADLAPKGERVGRDIVLQLLFAV